MQRAKCLECARFLQKRMARAMNKLKRLDHKLDLANPAYSKLHVPGEIFVPDDIAFDASFDGSDLVEQISSGTLWVNKRLKLSQKFVGELAAAADSARFDQRETFPGLAETGVIIFHARERTRERPAGTFRTETKIDTKQRTVSVGARKRLNNFLAQTVEPFVIGNAKQFPIIAIKKNKIDIGAMI